ncbi:hypothetical protein [Pseudogemmobacter bohemicus]|uniref:hypothetical protein n=1 Tax=Pseudogemmobacter bohemicus TaxID=2250708 RepID=UPI000DD4C9EB|nr:hypothetical protein [Pseudogemmobacter bohemicus]
MPDQPTLIRKNAALLCTLILTLALPAQAAEVTITDPSQRDAAGLLSGTCSLKLKGDIAAGDAARLEVVLEDESLGGGRSAGLLSGIMAEGKVLCLNSRGGDDREALALARVIRDRGLITAVPDGAQCIGACAVAFMAGSALSSNSDGGARMPMRVLHTGGILGFHAPALPDSDAALDYLAGLTDTFAGIDSYTPTARFHPQLLTEMLTHRDPAHPWLIDTTGKAGLYDIRLAGVPPIETDEAAWMRACNNLSLQSKGWQDPTDPDLSSWAWRVNLPEDGYEPEARQPPGDLPFSGNEDGTAAPPFFREVLSRHHQCLFYHDGEAVPPYAAWFERVSEDSSPQIRPFDLWQTLPHYTPLAALRGMDRVEPADFRTLYDQPPTVAPHPDLPVIRSFSPGQSVILESENGRVALWLGEKGEGRAYAAGEPAEPFTYRIEADQLCISRVNEEERCGQVVSDETDGVVFRTPDEDLRIPWMRPGDIGPLPPG